MTILFQNASHINDIVRRETISDRLKNHYIHVH